MQYDIGVINYGIGNVNSIANILQKLGINFVVITKASEIRNCKSLILPGVGSFDAAMKKLVGGNWIEPLNEFAKVERKPLLGICLGMQLLTKKSQEGKERGLGFIDAKTVLFNKDKMIDEVRIPHMSWNLINTEKDNKLFDTLIEQKFYFVHSYHVVCKEIQDVLTTTNYGYSFASSFSRGNIIGVQFHPEKSHHFGYNFFKNFIKEYVD